MIDAVGPARGVDAGGRTAWWAVPRDPGALVALAIGLLAAWPLLTRPGLPTLTDTEMHVYRAQQVEQSLRDGVLYPRWAPDLYYGYGYPVFNYYSPLTYHLAAWYSLASGTDAVAGIKAVAVLGFLVGAVGMYGLVRDRWHATAGVVAAIAFTLAPYVLYIDPHARGDIPEFFALSLAPLAMWAASRMLRTGAWRDVARAAVVVTVVILSHPLMALVVTGLTVAWMGWEFALGTGAEARAELARRQRWGRMALAVGLGLGGAAVLWIPALLERNAVHLQNVAGPGFFDFHQHFLSMREVFGPSAVMDFGATESRFVFNLGVAQWVLAGLGLLTGFHPRLRRRATYFFALAAVAMVYLMLPASTQLWETFRPLSLFQFPSRFLGPASVVLAVLAGAATAWGVLLTRRWMVLLVGGLAVLGCYVAALPLMVPKPWGEFGPVSTRRVLQVELDGRARGTTSGDEFLPASVVYAPGPTESLIRSYGEGTVDKVDREALPPGTEVSVLAHAAAHDEFLVRAPVAFVLRVLTFHFPGWTATVDSQSVPIAATEPDGFISVEVPAGEHRVQVRLLNTSAQWLGWAVSAAAWAIIGWLWVVGRRSAALVSSKVTWLSPMGAAALLAFLAAGGVFREVANSRGWLNVTSTGEQVLVAEREYRARLDNNLGLLAFDLDGQRFRPGEAVGITLYWKAFGPVPGNYQVYVHLFGPDGKLWGQSDKLNPAGFPTSRWPDDRYVRDEHEARLLPDAPQGEYRIVVGMWDHVTGLRLNAWTPEGDPLGDGIPLPVTLSVGGA